ncbi:MAG: type III pantothenate kinase [Urechidicola sp.]|nr:type III pantothenate kinase [Urechidicola sp.]
MNLIIDVGNTQVKLAVFEDSELMFNTVCKKDLLLIELKKIKKDFLIDQSIISSVAIFSEAELSEIKKVLPHLILLSHTTQVPFNNLYGTPQTLGVDRIAIAAASVSKYPSKNVLVIDAGTCITYDFVDENGSYLGGAITTGVKMRYKSLNKFTDRLPLLGLTYPKSIIGKTTEESIHSGIVNGVLAEINSIISQYKEQYKKLTVVLTGGDTNFLAKRLKNGIFANPIFLLEGLNMILIYNSKND